MWILEAVPQMSAFAVLTLIIGLVPLAMALAYVANPSERRLALMRPLSGSDGALTGVFSGFITVLRGIGATSTLTTGSWQRIAIGAGEALVPVFFGFACLTVAWILVALGMRRTA